VGLVHAGGGHARGDGGRELGVAGQRHETEKSGRVAKAREMEQKPHHLRVDGVKSP
jgi:hypothetical protein